MNISNGHAARMRYSRFKQSMETNPSQYPSRTKASGSSRGRRSTLRNIRSRQRLIDVKGRVEQMDSDSVSMKNASSGHVSHEETDEHAFLQDQQQTMEATVFDVSQFNAIPQEFGHESCIPCYSHQSRLFNEACLLTPGLEMNRGSDLLLRSQLYQPGAFSSDSNDYSLF
jgi:hypothetical protein